MTTTRDLSAVRRPITPGREMAALTRFFPDVTWTGTINAGGMGSGSPEMTAIGRGTHERIQDGRWIVGTYTQDQFLLDGTYVLTWKLHWVVGWDPSRGEYRATLADNYGHADVMSGHVDGDQLVFETGADAPIRLRLTWDVSDPSDVVWRNEAAIGEGPWMPVETYHMTPVDSADAGAQAPSA
jgi:Protein of unknown function (DUF1579)